MTAVLHDRAAHPAPPVRIAYVMSRFPKLSETFVLNEMIALESFGAHVDVYPLLRERQTVSHPEVHAWIARARYLPFLSLGILAANAHYALRQPRRYARMLRDVLGGTWRSPRMFAGTLAILPKSVRFAYEMEQSGVAHVHAHFAIHPALAAFVVHRLTDIPFSFTAHGSDVYVDRRMLAQKVNAAAFTVAISEFNRRIIIEECGSASADRVHVVHCGVDPDFFAPAPRHERDVVELVCVAVLEEKKGHRYLIDACAQLRDRGVRFRCHLVGDGPLRRELEQRVADAGLTEVVLLHGGRPRNEVAGLVAGADIAVLASHRTGRGKMEGIPVALMEAMACGVPVVATVMTGIPELVEHEVNGLLVRSGDAVPLADALETLARDARLRSRLGAAARAKVLEEFDLRANARRLLQLITSHGGASSDPMVVSAARQPEVSHAQHDRSPARSA